MTRQVLAVVVAAVALGISAAPAMAQSSLYEVDKTADVVTPDPNCDPAVADDCSLRDAINNANLSSGETITFNITPSSGVHVITLASDLPEITAPVTINGYSQPGSTESNAQTGAITADPTIVIDGENHNTLLVSGGASTIRGLVIYDAAGAAITLRTAGGDFIQGNFLGTSQTGGLPVADPGPGDPNRNVGPGIQILSGNNDFIGGLRDNRNVISGNGGAGIQISGGSGHTIDQNHIGTNKAGDAAVPNSAQGIYVNGVNPGPAGTIHDVTIGGTAELSGNVISGNGDSAVHFNGAGAGNKVLKNRIGTNAAGTAALANNGFGAVETLDAGVTIGDTHGNGNVISGNSVAGIWLRGANHTVQGNLIGTNADGTAALGNGGAGIQFESKSSQIGGTASNAGNVISGNGGAGFNGGSNGGVDDNHIEGNRIGTNAAGTAALGNGDGGIALVGGTGNTIGGSGDAANVISGNAGAGVLLKPAEGPPNDANNVLGNFIGTNASGAALGNSGPGVRVFQGRGNVIGRPGAGEGNTIADNGGAGVQVDGPEKTINDVLFKNDGNSIRGNSIFSNGALGIDLGAEDAALGDPGDGVTPNDSGDADSGPNERQNFPLVNAALPGGSTFVRGFLNSQPNTTYTIDLYRAPACDGSGNGEGREYLGSTTATTNAFGNALWSTTVTTSVPLGESVTATATDPLGNTSEFSACRESGTQVADQAIAPPAEQPQTQAPPQTITPQPQGPAPNPCTDKKAPITRLKKAGVKNDKRGSKLVLSGTSADHRDCPSGVARVDVSLARVAGRTGTNCRFIKTPNRTGVTRPQNCRRPVLFKATGTDKWTFTFPVRLPKGLYRVQARGTDKAKNKETPKKNQNIVFFEVK